MSQNDTTIQTLYEGEDFSIYRVEDGDGEVGFDVTLFDSVTVHFIKDEWNDFLTILKNFDPEA